MYADVMPMNYIKTWHLCCHIGLTMTPTIPNNSGKWAYICMLLFKTHTQTEIVRRIYVIMVPQAAAVLLRHVRISPRSTEVTEVNRCQQSLQERDPLFGAPFAHQKSSWTPIKWSRNSWRWETRHWFRQMNIDMIKRGRGVSRGWHSTTPIACFVRYRGGYHVYPDTVKNAHANYAF